MYLLINAVGQVISKHSAKAKGQTALYEALSMLYGTTDFQLNLHYDHATETLKCLENDVPVLTLAPRETTLINNGKTATIASVIKFKGTPSLDGWFGTQPDVCSYLPRLKEDLTKVARGNHYYIVIDASDNLLHLAQVTKAEIAKCRSALNSVRTAIVYALAALPPIPNAYAVLMVHKDDSGNVATYAKRRYSDPLPEVKQTTRKAGPTSGMTAAERREYYQAQYRASLLKIDDDDEVPKSDSSEQHD